MAEVEEYRLELVKESNQHAAETGEKIGELRAQLAALTAEKVELEQDLGRLKAADSPKVVQMTAGFEDLVAERDNLKEKNEKLKVMCKKYVAKLKQMEGGQSGGKSSPLQSRISEEDEERHRREVEQLRAETAALNEVVAANNSALAALEANFADSLAQLDASAAEVERLTREAGEREATLTAKDDLVRELKTKLEAAPENITVPVGRMMEDQAEEAARAKTELAAIRDKCKKLIVKVKQQDELLKKERLKSVASNSSAHEEDAADMAANTAALTAEKDALLAEKTALAAEKDSLVSELATLTDQLATTQVSQEELKEESAGLRQRISELEANSHSSLEALTAKIDRLVAERTVAYETQTELKAELLTLKQEKQAAVAAREAVEGDLRRLREANLVSQMQASSMLQVKNSKIITNISDRCSL